jgi:hypothetical protein
LKDVHAVQPRYRAKRHDGNRHQRTAQGDHRRNQEQRTLDGQWHQVFFQEELCAVDQRLQQAKRSNAAGSPPVLHVANYLALQQHRIGHTRQSDD